MKHQIPLFLNNLHDIFKMFLWTSCGGFIFLKEKNSFDDCLDFEASNLNSLFDISLRFGV